jgi:sec-independent protein translocase protein TatA
MAALLALPEGGEWIVILVIVVLVFGANKLPDLTRNAAKAMVEFKKVTGKTDDPDDKTAALRTAEPPADATTTAAGTTPAAAEAGTAAPDGEAAKQDSPPA